MQRDKRITSYRPHLLGIDDAPFVKGKTNPVPIVGVMMEGADLVEGVSIGQFEIDGENVTSYLCEWITSMRWITSIQSIIIGGVTIAGLSIVDMPLMYRLLKVPVLSVTRNDTRISDLDKALMAAGLPGRIEILKRIPEGRQLGSGLFLTHCGIENDAAEKVLAACIHKSLMPEPLRIAHLIGAAIVHGQSRGRV